MTDTETLEAVFTSKLKVYDDRGRWATPEEGRVLFDLVTRQKIGLVCEIGTANGWTACWSALAGADVLTFDTVNRPKVYEDKSFPFPALKNKIFFTNVGSPQCASLIKQAPRDDSPFLFFIDGDHSDAGLTVDFEALKPQFRTGDLIVFHDTKKSEIGVYRFWKRMNRNYPGQCQGYSTRNGMGVLTW